jgi:hypothetical protein
MSGEQDTADISKPQENDRLFLDWEPLRQAYKPVAKGVEVS